MISGPALWAVLAVINIPVYVFIGKVVFGTWENFLEALRFWITPELFSALMGEFWDDCWAELKLFFFVAACGACLYGEYMFLQRFM